MRRFAGACRFVFNRALALQNENHEAGNKYVSYTKMASWLVEWKSHPDTQWLKDTPSQPLQQSLKDLERGYKNFFQKRAAFPRFKKRGQNDAFRYPQGVKLDQANNRISLPKLGWVPYRNSREVIGEVKNVTVSQSCGKWYVSIQTEYEVADPVHNAESMVGLDAGVTKLATLSDGMVYHPVNSFKTNQRKLAMLQRQLSRKVKFSANWQKQKRIKGMRERGEKKVRLAEAENVLTLSEPTGPDWLNSNVYRPSQPVPAMKVVPEEEEYTEDEYLNNSLDILESNKRKNAI